MGLREQLDAAGYDVSGIDEASILKQLDSAGYDTSSLGKPQPDYFNEPGLQSVIPGQDAVGGVVADLITKEGGVFQKAGEAVAEAFPNSPKMAALAGTSLAMIPHVLTSGLKGMKVGKAAVEGVETVAKKGMEVGKTVVDAFKYTGAKEAERLGVKKAEQAVLNIDRKALAQEQMKEVGEAIGKVEENLNISASKTQAAARRFVVKTQEKATMFADRAGRLADKGADKLAEMASPETLQFFRKTASDAIKKYKTQLADEALTKLYKTQKVFGEALAKTEVGAKAGLKDSLEAYSSLSKYIKELPIKSKRELRVIEAAIAKAEALAKEQLRTRVKAGGGALAAAVALGGRKAVNLVTGGQ